MMLADNYTGSLFWLPSLLQSQQNVSQPQLSDNSNCTKLIAPNSLGYHATNRQYK
jgi:hypothetical protein